jgi:hypothetical protein
MSDYEVANLYVILHHQCLIKMNIKDYNASAYRAFNAENHWCKSRAPGHQHICVDASPAVDISFRFAPSSQLFQTFVFY